MVGISLYSLQVELHLKKITVSTRPSGVIWAGPVYNIGGYGNVSRNYIKSFLKTGIPLRIINMDNISGEIGYKNIKLLNSLTKTHVGSSPILIVHSLPSIFKTVNITNAYKKIGCTIFETDKIPKDWARECNKMDEIWVPSRFNFETFSKAGVRKNKLKVIPYSVDTNFFNPQVKPLKLPKLKSFKFLYVFNFSYRKAPELLLDAYLREFNSEDDVCLILKSIGTDYPTLNFDQTFVAKIKRKVKKSAHDFPQVFIIKSKLTNEKLASLYAACSCYISVDRANGWGMPCMEAMAMHKPAATINWSGSTEFMSAENSYLIQPKKLIPVDKRFVKLNPIYQNQLWAEIDIKRLRNLLREVYADGQRRMQIAANGYRTVTENYSIEQVSKLLPPVLGFSSRKSVNRLFYFINVFTAIKRKLKRLSFL